MIRTFDGVMVVMMMMMMMVIVAMTLMVTAVAVEVGVVLVEADASDVKDLDAHVDDRGVLILFLSRSVQCTVWMGTSETGCF